MPDAQGLAHEAERRIATVLFVDLVGAAGLGERLDVESLQDIAEEFYKEASSVVTELGGIVGRYAGDAVMAVFGIPQAHEDDVDRALTAAVTLISRVRDLSQRLAPAYGEQLAIHCGVHTGELVVPVSGDIDLGTVAADTVNVAARLQQEAAPGEVLVSERTARTAARYAFEDRGDVELRGRRAPVHVFALAGEEDRASLATQRREIFGRADELASLEADYEKASYSRFPRLTVVVGDAGIGKTRVVEEFTASLATAKKSPTVFRARCLPFGEEFALGPLSEMIQALRSGEQWLPGDTAILFATLDRQRDRESKGDLDSTDAKTLDRDVRQAWCDYFESVSRRGPTVLLVEDLHWADAKLLDVLEAVLQSTTGALLLVCTTRPDLDASRPSWMEDEASLLELGPLDTANATSMLNSLAGRRPLAPDVLTPLVTMANGNPLFLEHLLDQLIDERRIVATPTEWVWAKGGAIGLPDSVQAVLSARIDLLSPFDALTLRYAAAIGQSFWAGSLALVHSAPLESVLEALDRLVVRNLVAPVERSSLPGQVEYAFNHVLAREVAYVGLTHRERAAAHDLTYRWLASVSAKRQDVVDLLARQASSACDEAAFDPRLSEDERLRLRIRALEAVLEAASAARSSVSLEKADRLAQRALAFTVTAEERAAALEEWGRIALFAYEGDGAWDRLREAIDLRHSSEPAESSALARLCALALETPIRWPGTMRAAPSEEEVAKYMELGLSCAGDGDSEARALLLLLKGFWHHAYSPDQDGERLVAADDALRAADEAADMANRLGRPDLESAALDGVSATWIPRGRYDRAREATLRRVGLVDDLVDSREVGDIHAMCGWTHFHIGRYREAADFADAGFELTVNEVPSVALHCLVWRTLARFHLGDWDRLQADADLGRELLGPRANEPPHFVSPMFAAEALTHELQGNRVAADALLEMLASLDERADAIDRDTAPLARWASWVARILAHRRRFDEAHALLAATRWRRGTRQGLLLHAQCMVTADEGDWDAAPTLVAESRVEARRGGLEALFCAADHLEGSWLSATGNDAEGVAALHRAVDGFGRCEARWEQALAHAALGRALAKAGKVNLSANEMAAAAVEFSRLEAKPLTPADGGV
jgi:class 3 adenylate cyclase/tetratricopeptide (TPR) repeat protein